MVSGGLLRRRTCTKHVRFINLPGSPAAVEVPGMTVCRDTERAVGLVVITWFSGATAVFLSLQLQDWDGGSMGSVLPCSTRKRTGPVTKVTLPPLLQSGSTVGYDRRVCGDNGPLFRVVFCTGTSWTLRRRARCRQSNPFTPAPPSCKGIGCGGV